MYLLHEHSQFLCGAEQKGWNQNPWNRNLQVHVIKTFTLLLHCENKIRIVFGRDRRVVFLTVLAKVYRSSFCIGMEGFKHSVPFLCINFSGENTNWNRNSFHNVVESDAYMWEEVVFLYHELHITVLLGWKSVIFKLWLINLSRVTRWPRGLFVHSEGKCRFSRSLGCLKAFIPLLQKYF